MTEVGVGRLRAATAADRDQLIQLWTLLFERDGTDPGAPWGRNAEEWFDSTVDDRLRCRFPVVEVDDEIVATGIGILELGVPNPYCLRGRTAQIKNVITLPAHRGQGYGRAIVLDVIAWAKAMAADRVDLSATPDGVRVYSKLGFVMTSAPRMKLML